VRKETEKSFVLKVDSWGGKKRDNGWLKKQKTQNRPIQGGGETTKAALKKNGIQAR